MQFKDIEGQEEVKNRLRKSVLTGRIPHAQLFAGRSGIGKLQLAIAYAQYLACEHRTEEDSCGQCPSCLQYQKLQHPDLHFAYPIVKSNSVTVCDDVAKEWRELILNQGYFDQDDWYRELGEEKKQGMIYEKESSEILRKLSLKSFSDGYKVMVIWLPEKMNVACSNKLLKLLEEPPQETLFLLVSEQPEQLLSTIISRTQIIRVPALSEQDLSSAVMRRCGKTTNEAAEIAHIAQGSLLTAVRMASDAEQNKQFFDDFAALMRNAWMVGDRRYYPSLLALRDWCLRMTDGASGAGREKQKAFLQYAQRQIRENFIYNMHCPEMNYETSAEVQFSTRFAPFINERNVEDIMNELDKAELQISQNGNAKIILFDLCLQMIILIKK